MPNLSVKLGTWVRVTLALGVTAAVLAACQINSNGNGPTGLTSTPNAQGTETAPNVPLGIAYTPQQIRDAYGVTSLYNKGDQGQGQTIVFIESYGSPTLQQDLAIFDQQFGLPTPNLQILSPLGSVPYDANNSEMIGWQQETTLDVEEAHSIAPKANLVVLTSPVDETEGVQGLPQFLQLEQYNVDHHLGNVVSNSWGASEASLSDAAGQTEIAQWDPFLQQAATQNHITFLASSGDNGSIDCLTFDDSSGQCSQFTTAASTSFVDDSPWVTSVGGTTLKINNGTYSETVWNSNGGASGGGFSQFYSTPDFQKGLAASDQSLLAGRRGVPDVAASADPGQQLAIYVAGQWTIIGGTSAAAPLWAGITALADQIAGRPLGDLNPAIYQIGESAQYSGAFRDITQGDNTDSSNGNVSGYQATTGWDPTTGWGTPNAANLIPLLIKDIPA